MKFYSLMLFALSLCAPVFADPGLDLAKKIDQANNGYIGELAQMEMTLEDAHGTKIIRELTGQFMEVTGDGDRSLMSFITPKDVRGTKMLTWTHKDRDDDQWLYLPAVKRVKRISSKNKTSSFMGAEFSYEDLSSQEVEKYSYKLLPEVKSKELGDVWGLEKTPLKESGYSKQVHYISKKYLQAVKVEYFDKKNSLLKIATSNDFKSYKVGAKSFYKASVIRMENVQTRKASSMIWKTRSLGKKFNDRDFQERNLR